MFGSDKVETILHCHHWNLILQITGADNVMDILYMDINDHGAPQQNEYVGNTD